MLTRRLLVGALCAQMAARPAFSQEAMPPMGSLRFDILRNQGRIGRHSVQLDRQGNIVTARILVEVAVSIGPIVVYRYGLTATETWRDGRFAAFDSECNDDGTRLRVRAESREEGVVVRTDAAPRLVLPPDAVPMTHWNQACLRAPLFEARDGKPARPKVTPRGRESVALADGRTIQADRYSYSGDTELDDWYDTAGSWAAMRTTGRDGSIIEYRRLGA
jgi:hypothetical protein